MTTQPSNDGQGELRKRLDNIFPSPATGTRGQGGLPVTGSVTDYVMYYTKDGEEFVYKQIEQLINQEVRTVLDNVTGEFPDPDSDAGFSPEGAGSWDLQTYKLAISDFNAVVAAQRAKYE